MIINSWDYGSVDKQVLWPIAFDRLGDGIGYKNALLIEDNEVEVNRFCEHGGFAIRYCGDEEFTKRLSEVNRVMYNMG